MKIEHVFFIVLFLVAFGFSGIAHFHGRGVIEGRCIEMCRPAQFDTGQKVHGGCLCIGSDKVLRFKKVP